MLIRLTKELKAQALEVAQRYKPLRDPLLVGSCVWLGEGHVTIHGDTHQRRFDTDQEAADWVVCKRKELHGEYAKA